MTGSSEMPSPIKGYGPSKSLVRFRGRSTYYAARVRAHLAAALERRAVS